MHPNPAKAYSRPSPNLNGHVLDIDAAEQRHVRRTSGGGAFRKYLLSFALTLCAFVLAATLATSWSAIRSQWGAHHADGSSHVAVRVTQSGAVAAALEQLQQNQSEVLSLLNQITSTQKALAESIHRAPGQAGSRAEQQTAGAGLTQQTAPGPAPGTAAKAADGASDNIPAAMAALPALTKLHNHILRLSKDFMRHRQFFKELLDQLVHMPAGAALKEVQQQLTSQAHEPLKVFIYELYKLMLNSGKLIPCREDSTLVIGDTVSLNSSSSSGDSSEGSKHTSNIPKYYFATNLRDNTVQMPHYILSLLQTLLRLPRDAAFVSVYESDSDDVTHSWIEVMQLALNIIGTQNRIVTRGMLIKTNGQYRIDFLAKVRNMAMAPLYSYYAQQQQAGSSNSSEPSSSSGSGVQLGVLSWDPDYVVFINDVFFCWDMVLRLMNYRADITCGTDWLQGKVGSPPELKHKMSHGKPKIPDQLKLVTPIDNPMAPDQENPIIVYDVWVSRDVAGSRFWFTHPFIMDKESSPVVKQGLPVRVSCCWNGLAVLNADPFKKGLKFRMHQEGECRASECTLLCNDFARLGYTDVVVDTGVQVAYDWHLAREMMAVGIEGVGQSTWAQVKAAGISQATRQPDYSNVECCNLRPGAQGVSFPQDCFIQNIMKTNYTQQAIESNMAWK